MNRVDFQHLSEMRLEDARALLDAARYGGAYYFTGIAVECGIKAAIAKLTAAHDFPPKPDVVKKYDVHSLAELLKHAGLEKQLSLDSQALPLLRRNWDVIKSWEVDDRYSSTASAQTATDMLVSASDPNSGVIPWLKAHW